MGLTCIKFLRKSGKTIFGLPFLCVHHSICYLLTLSVSMPCTHTHVRTEDAHLLSVHRPDEGPLCNESTLLNSKLVKDLY